MAVIYIVGSFGAGVLAALVAVSFGMAIHAVIFAYIGGGMAFLLLIAAFLSFRYSPSTSTRNYRSGSDPNLDRTKLKRRAADESNLDGGGEVRPETDLKVQEDKEELKLSKV